ncbi:MAG TPA: hypothetical protein VHH91_05470, partial [Vicinamibacterales bacterium]|nr:hypothetical protein [Vicinamibacterales bacterium]
MLWWPVTRAAAPAVVPRWADQVLYFAIVDRFADGDSVRNVNVDRTVRGAFHGGDLKGLREHLGTPAAVHDGVLTATV